MEKTKETFRWAIFFIEDSFRFIKDFGLLDYIDFIKNNKDADIYDLCEMLERTYEC